MTTISRIYNANTGTLIATVTDWQVGRVDEIVATQAAYGVPTFVTAETVNLSASPRTAA